MLNREVAHKSAPSPILANLLLGKLDKKHEILGHGFIRHADDVCLFVKKSSQRSACKQAVSDYIEKALKLKMNAVMSEVTRLWKSRLFNYSFFQKRVRKGAEDGKKV